MNQLKDWPQAPIHRLGSDGVYMVTGATLYMQQFFIGSERLNVLEQSLLSLAKDYGWQLEAWAAFVNHYHLIARSNADAKNLRSTSITYIPRLHVS